MTVSSTWWGDFKFAQNETKCWRIGERVIAITRNEREWLIHDKTTDLEINQAIKVSKPKAKESFEEAICTRFLLANTNDTITIEPSLADRAMIVRPSVPFIIMPSENIKVFVSTPLWMTILIAQLDIPITDIPFWRPSDSWFGPSTMHGDICYSKYTDAKIDIDTLEKRAHRASTMVTIKNDQEEPLTIERLNLPVPALKLYVDENKDFWTDQVVIKQSIEHGKSVSELRHSPPEHSSSMSLVSESRELSKKSSFLSSIKSLIA